MNRWARYTLTMAALGAANVLFLLAVFLLAGFVGLIP